MLSLAVIMVVLTGPGLLICTLYRIRSHFFLGTLALSLATFLGTTELARFFGSPAILNYWIWFSSICCMTSIIAGVHKQLSDNRSDSKEHRHFWSKTLILDCFIGLFAICYVIFVDAYLVIPADVFFHLGEIQATLASLSAGSIPDVSPWYLILGVALHFSGDSFDSFLLFFPILTTLLFLLSIRVFSSYIANQRGALRRHESVFVLLSVLFSFLFFGTSVFSFVRYYAFAPVALTLPIFFLILPLFLTRRGEHWAVTSSALNLTTISAVCATLWFFHKQESLFILLAGATFVCFATWSILLAPKSFLKSFRISVSSSNWVSFVLFFNAGSWIIYALFPLEVAQVVRDNTIPITLSGFGVSEFVIGDPLGRSFETMGLVGYSAIAIYLLPPLRNLRSPTVLALIATPLMTVFNPIFASLFSKFTLPSVLWRLFYMVPIGVLLASIVVGLVYLSYSRVLKYGSGAILLLTAYFPLPGMTFFQYRVESLQATPRFNSPEIWGDLIHEVRELGRVNLLTDPVTGYVLSALTKAEHSHNKFSPTEVGEINKRIYREDSFLDHALEGNWYFVVNLRDGEESVPGRLSRHWSPDIMKTQELYSLELLEWLGFSQQNSAPPFTLKDSSKTPPHFRLVWERDRIWIFSLNAGN